MGYLLAKCGESNGDHGGCGGLWGVSGGGRSGFWCPEFVEIKQCMNRCAGTVSKVSFFGVTTNMSICEMYYNDLCLCQPVLRYVEAVETMKNP